MSLRLTLAASAALAITACNAAEPDDSATSRGEVSAPADTGFVMVPGVYEMVGDDVVYSRTEIRPDGVYVDSADGKEVGRGIWSVSGPKSCFDPDGDGPDQQERCWTNGVPAEDGSFLTTRVDGSESYTVRPAASE